MIRSTGDRSYAFQAEGERLDLTGVWYPVEVGLTIGSDKGSVVVVGHGMRN